MMVLLVGSCWNIYLCMVTAAQRHVKEKGDPLTASWSTDSKDPSRSKAEAGEGWKIHDGAGLDMDRQNVIGEGALLARGSRCRIDPWM